MKMEKLTKKELTETVGGTVWRGDIWNKPRFPFPRFPGKVGFPNTMGF